MIAAEAAVLRSAMAMDCIATWNLEPGSCTRTCITRVRVQ